MAHRIRRAMRGDYAMFAGPVEVDEAYLGGKSKNRHWVKRKAGRGTVGKTPVIRMRDRATNAVLTVPVQSADRATVENATSANLQVGTKV